MAPSPPVGWDGADLQLTPGGRGLDVACGRGGTAIWLAQQDLDVVALDVSPVAVAATEALAATFRVSAQIDARVHDLDAGLPARLGHFDVIVCQRFRAPALVPSLLDHVAVGGLVVLTVLSAVGADRPGRHHAPPRELADAVADAAFDRLVDLERDGLATVIVRRVG